MSLKDDDGRGGYAILKETRLFMAQFNLAAPVFGKHYGGQVLK
jgi:hypothetical protein